MKHTTILLATMAAATLGCMTAALGGDILDASPLANHGIGFGFVEADQVAGVADGALWFDGVGKYVETRDYDGLDGLHGGTVSAWIRTLSNGTVVAYCGEDNNRGLWAFTVGTGGAVRIASKVAASGEWAYLDGEKVVNDGVWHHLAATADGSGPVRIYVDGVADTVTVRGIGGSSSDWWADAYMVTAVVNHVNIGTLRRPAVMGRLAGTIDEVRLCAVPRSSNWVWACWMNGASNGMFTTGASIYSADSVDAHGIPAIWKIRHFGATNAVDSGALDDWDHDGLNNYGEWRAGTDPRDAGSRLEVSGVEWRAGTNFVIRWPSVTGKWYAIDRATNLVDGFLWNVGSNILATPDVNVKTIQVQQVREGFYRVRLE